VSRLHQISRVLDQAMGHMRDGVRDHLIPPTYLLEKVSSQAQGIADDSLDKSHSQNRCASFPIPSLSRSAINCERRSKPW